MCGDGAGLSEATTLIFDSHCHLDPETYGGDAAVDDVIATAVASGVTRMLSVGSGYGDGSAARAVAVAKRHPEVVWASVGLHPHDASMMDAELLDTLLALADNSEVVAWGEMGLDFFYDNSPRDIQRKVFRQQIRVALELDLPMIIHDRDSDWEAFSVLKSEGAFERGRVLYHCYAGNLEQLDELVSHGGWISLPGVVTWKKSALTKEVAKAVPAEKLLVETDSPFLTPEPLRGRRNEPCHVALTVAEIASLRGVHWTECAEFTTKNAIDLFRL
jgi:TatD DNase family protein